MKLKKTFVIGRHALAIFLQCLKSTHFIFLSLRFFIVFAGYWLRAAVVITDRNLNLSDFLFFFLDFFSFQSTQFDFSLDGGVPVVFYAIVSSAWQKFWNNCPFISVNIVSCQQGKIFLFFPLLFVDIRIQVIVPSFPTLLPDSVFEFAGDLRPIPRSVLFNQLEKQLVFFRSPIAFLFDYFELFGGLPLFALLAGRDWRWRKTVIFFYLNGRGLIDGERGDWNKGHQLVFRSSI